jgi:hypothetical protein
MNLANEGLEARKKEDEVNAKKRKAEEDAAWEGMLPFNVILCLILTAHFSESGTTSRELA